MIDYIKDIGIAIVSAFVAVSTAFTGSPADEATSTPVETQASTTIEEVVIPEALEIPVPPTPIQIEIVVPVAEVPLETPTEVPQEPVEEEASIEEPVIEEEVIEEPEEEVVETKEEKLAEINLKIFELYQRYLEERQRVKENSNGASASGVSSSLIALSWKYEDEKAALQLEYDRILNDY